MFGSTAFKQTFSARALKGSSGLVPVGPVGSKGAYRAMVSVARFHIRYLCSSMDVIVRCTVGKRLVVERRTFVKTGSYPVSGS